MTETQTGFASFSPKNVNTAYDKLLYMVGKHAVIVGKLSMKIGPTFPDILNSKPQQICQI